MVKGTSGISVHQNGLTAAYSQSGNQEVTASSKSPDGGVGLKDFESMFDESFNHDNIAVTDAYNALEDTLNIASKSVENGNVNLDFPKDPLPEAEVIDVERDIQKQVFTLNDASNGVENGSVHLDLPKDDPLPEVQEVDVEREIKKHVYTLNNAPQSVDNGSVNHGLTEDPLPEVEEFDVERVIQKQETHDFYCPNCNSCITKRVVLKRRKRKIQDISPSEDAGSFPTPAQTAPPPSDGIVQGTDENEPLPDDGALDEPIYAITCLSCLSVFLPCGNNGWLSRIFGRKPEVPAQPADLLTEPLLSPRGGTDGGDNGQGNVFPLWIVTCCQPSSDGKRPLPPVPREPEPEPEPEPEHAPAQGHPGRLSEGNGDLQPTEHGTEPPLTPPDEGSKEEIKPYLPEETKLPSKPEPPNKLGKYPLQQIAPAPPKPHLPEVPNGKPVSPEIEPDSDSTFALWFVNCCQPNKDGSRLKLPDKSDTPLPPKREPASGVGTELPHDSEAPTTPVAGTPVSPKPEPMPEPGTGTPFAPEPTPISAPADDVDTRVPSTPTPEPIPGGGTPLAPAKPMPKPSPTPGDGGKPTITTLGEVAHRPPPLAPIPDDVPHQTGPLQGLDNSLLEQGLPRPRGGTGIDIIKAIVYGGLLESITSLSVIASAAGGDATTLNIVALGLANVFGGLVLLFHNLRILKREHATEHYIQELGRPGHFLLHATVAVISYLLFGLMAPIIYGFSFRKSDNKDFKLATLAAASFVCVLVLSTAKAYVRSPPKAYIQTVFYYLSIGFMVSGLGYVAGDLINELLKKLGVFDPKSVVPQGGDVKGLWASY